MTFINSIKIAAPCSGLTVISAAQAETAYAIHHNKHGGDYSSLKLNVHYSDNHRKHRYRDKHRYNDRYHNRHHSKRYNRHDYRYRDSHRSHRGKHDHRYCNDYRSRSNFAYSLYFNNFDRLKHHQYDKHQSRNKHYKQHKQHRKHHDRDRRGHGRTSRN